jgi:hypothetical protein
VNYTLTKSRCNSLSSITRQGARVSQPIGFQDCIAIAARVLAGGDEVIE